MTEPTRRTPSSESHSKIASAEEPVPERLSSHYLAQVAQNTLAFELHSHAGGVHHALLHAARPTPDDESRGCIYARLQSEISYFALFVKDARPCRPNFLGRALDLRVCLAHLRVGLVRTHQPHLFPI